MPGNGVRQRTTKTLRLRGSTGSATPAISATSPAWGPAALTSVPQAMRSPEASPTDAMRSPCRSIDADGAGDVDSAGRPRRLAKEVEERMGVEPAFAGAAEGAGGDAGQRQPGEALCEVRGSEQRDVGALRPLHVPVPSQDLLPGGAGEEQVPAFAKADIGPGAEAILEAAEDFDPELAHADVLGRRELLADRGRREGGRRSRIRGITLDDGNAPGMAELGFEEVGDRGADGRAADDDDV